MNEVTAEIVTPVPPVDPVRVETTVKLLLTGTRAYDVADAVRQLWPDQELQPLVMACLESLEESGKFEADVLRGWCVEATKSIYRKCIAEGEWAAALRAIKQIHDFAMAAAKVKPETIEGA